MYNAVSPLRDDPRKTVLLLEDDGDLWIVLDGEKTTTVFLHNEDGLREFPRKEALAVIEVINKKCFNHKKKCIENKQNFEPCYKTTRVSDRKSNDTKRGTIISRKVKK